MPYRVIQWSTGNVGKLALRAILHNPELELVGLWVSSDAKAGRDAGELCGMPPVGVKATTDADALLAMQADCVSYNATADLRPGEATDDLCRILESGKNVVSTSIVPPWRTTRSQMAGGLASGRMAQSDQSRVTTELAYCTPLTNSMPHLSHVSASARTISPAWSYSAAYRPLTLTSHRKSPRISWK